MMVDVETRIRNIAEALSAASRRVGGVVRKRPIIPDAHAIALIDEYRAGKCTQHEAAAGAYVSAATFCKWVALDNVGGMGNAE